MGSVFLLRLALDFLAVGLFRSAMAYWWLDNRLMSWSGRRC